MDIAKNEQTLIKLNQQVLIIHESLKSVEYLINLPKYLEKIENDKPLDLWFLYNVIRNNTISNLYKLFGPNQDYSFDRIKSLIINNIERDNIWIINYLSNLKEARKLYNSLRINKIRNTHVSHLDYNRKNESLNWKEVKKLITLSCKIHDSINLYLNKQQTGWIVEEKILNQIFTKDLVYKKLYEKKIEVSKRVSHKINIEELYSLTNIHWP